MVLTPEFGIDGNTIAVYGVVVSAGNAGDGAEAGAGEEEGVGGAYRSGAEEEDIVSCCGG